MQIAIFSDVHDNLANLDKFLRWCTNQKIDQLIFCGDLTSAETIEYLADLWSNPLYLVWGNACQQDEVKKAADKINNFTHFGWQADFVVRNKKVGVVHFPELAEELGKTGKFDFVFYGHTHKPWQKKISNTVLLNPGTLAGLYNKATFALWDVSTNHFILKLVEKI